MTLTSEPPARIENNFVFRQPMRNINNQSFGFSLIELIGVSAVVAILALALAPILIKQLDQIAGDKETAQLKAFEAAFRQGVLKTKTIPNESGWAQMIATNFSVPIAQVTNNDRSVPRVFVIDPEFFQSGGGAGPLTYIQNANGFTVGGVATAPFSPRLMILSSISVPLTNISSGVAPLSGLNAFSNIWNTSEGFLPSGWTWKGRPEDLKIQRIHLGDVFVQTVMGSDATTGGGGKFYIEGAGPNISAVPVDSRYFIDSTRLELYDCTTPTPQYSEILHRSKSFTFSYCNWQGGDQFFFQKAIARPTPFDLQLAADSFLALASDNPQRSSWSGNNPVQRSNVYNNMAAYMSNYVLWASNNFPSGAANPGGYMGSAENNLDASTSAIIHP